MRCLRVAVVACGLVAGPAPAAASEAGADCMSARLSADDRVLLGEYALGGERAPAGLDTRLAAHAQACADSLSLTGEQLDQAGVNLLSRLVMERTGVRLDVAGIPSEALDAWFDGQSETVRASYGRDGMSDAEMTALTASMTAVLESRGIATGQVRAQAGLIRVYLNARALRFRLGRDPP